MIPTSVRTRSLIALMFPPEETFTVEKILANQCAENIGGEDEIGLERIRFANLKLSEGHMDKLTYWIQQSSEDYRDVFVAAGFLSPWSHELWFDDMFRASQTDAWSNGADFDPTTLHDWDKVGPDMIALASTLDIQPYFKLASREYPWGDYGEILWNGMTQHLARSDDLLQLERTGPFVPSISFELDIILSNSLKIALEASHLRGVAFKPVIKARIVLLEWEKWDQDAEDPFEYPESGEPEDYILEKPHSPELATQIGDLWELCLESFDHLEDVNADFWRIKGTGFTFVSEAAKRWLEENAPETVRFIQLD